MGLNFSSMMPRAIAFNKDAWSPEGWVVRWFRGSSLPKILAQNLLEVEVDDVVAVVGDGDVVVHRGQRNPVIFEPDLIQGLQDLPVISHGGFLIPCGGLRVSNKTYLAG